MGRIAETIRIPSNDVRSVALGSWNIQVTSKGADQTDQADLRHCWLLIHVLHLFKFHVAAQLLFVIVVIRAFASCLSILRLLSYRLNIIWSF